MKPMLENCSDCPRRSRKNYKTQQHIRVFRLTMNGNDPKKDIQDYCEAKNSSICTEAIDRLVLVTQVSAEQARYSENRRKQTDIG